MSHGPDSGETDVMEPDNQHARRTALVAHSVVAKLQEMGLPNDLEDELATLSTDLGDLWSAQRELADQLEGLVRSEADWSTVGDRLVDLRATVDHISWHLRSVRRPMTKITQYAYRMAPEGDSTD